MMQSYLRISLWLLMMLIAGSSRAQKLQFRQLTVNDGLSNNSVMAIYQDEKGFMWFGTRDGLNLYNGHRVITYRAEKGNLNSIVSNTIKRIVGNGKGEIYINTNRGISKFDTHIQEFSTLLLGEGGDICYHDALYASYNNAIYRYGEGGFTLFYELKSSQTTITSFCLYEGGIMIGTKGNGLFKADHNGQCKQLIPQGHITHIFRDSKGYFWVGSWEEGAYLIRGDEVTRFAHRQSDSSSISSNFVRHFCEDRQGHIWIGTFHGLNRFDASTHTFQRYVADQNCNLTSSSVWSLFCDRQGTLWLGTYYGGVNYYNPKGCTYTHLFGSHSMQQMFSPSVVGCITEDDDHNLWIGIEGKGICRYTLSNSLCRWYGQSDGLSHNNVNSICYDSQRQVVWAGTHTGGLNRLDVKTGRITSYTFRSEQKELQPNIVRSILLDGDRLLLATHGGVYAFYPETGRSVRLFADENFDMCVSICKDQAGHLWMSGNGKGVYRYDPATLSMKNYRHNQAEERSICENHISYIYEDSQHRLWFCSSNSGIDLYHPENDDFENLDMKGTGLNSNSIHSICELSPDRLLLTTNEGFSILDISKRTLTNYNRENGFPLLSSDQRVAFCCSNGTLCVGGIDGLVMFREEALNQRMQDYRIYPFQMSINGKPIAVGKVKGTLPKALSDLGELKLNSDQSVISIEYAVTNYVPTGGNRLEYKLKGFSPNWIEMNSLNTITYTNLTPGRYTLIVRVKDTPDIPESRLAIHVLPPFYLTWTALGLYLICIVGGLALVIHAYKRRIKLQESLKYERWHTEQIEQLNRSKLRFFANISHEFRTPLTLIIGQMESLLQMSTIHPSIYNKILKVYKNGVMMKELISELLDFQKQEQGFMSVRVSEQDIVAFVRESCLLFQEYADQQQVTLRFNTTQEEILLWFDAKQMQKVLNNLLSNAFKHTPKEGKIEVNIRKGFKEVVIEVSDTGCGIPAEEIEKIFHRFYQVEQNNTAVGTGIGLALTKGIVELHHGRIEVFSELHEGTTFCIHLNLGREAFGEQEIADTEEVVTLDKAAVGAVAMQPMKLQEDAEEEALIPGRQHMVTLPERQHKVLVVEDNEALRQMIVELLNPFYQVVEASNGEEGWNRVVDELPSLVVSDVVMPQTTGTELCRRIKENFDTCHIPLILLTARTSIEHKLEGLRYGADDYITKPFHTQILLARCANLINNLILLQEKFSNQADVTPQIMTTNPTDKAFMNRLMESIEKNISDVSLNIENLAQDLGISRTSLFNKMKSITGKTPYEFLLMVRLKKAAVMLKQNQEMSIKEISILLGFSSPRQFSKNFKEKYSITPQEFRTGEPNDDLAEDEEE